MRGNRICRGTIQQLWGMDGRMTQVRGTYDADFFFEHGFISIEVDEAIFEPGEFVPSLFGVKIGKKNGSPDDPEQN